MYLKLLSMHSHSSLSLSEICSLLGLIDTGKSLAFKAGGTINTAMSSGQVDTCVDSSSIRPLASDSSQFDFKFLSFFLVLCQVASTFSNVRSLIIETGTDTLASVSYLLCLIKPAFPHLRVGCVGSMYCKDDELFDGKKNRVLLDRILDSDKSRCYPFYVIDQQCYPGHILQKQSSMSNKSAFGEGMFFDCTSIETMPSVYSKFTDFDIDTLYLSALFNFFASFLVSSIDPKFNSDLLPCVFVIGVTETTDNQLLSELLDNFLVSGPLGTSYLIYGTLPKKCVRVIEYYLPKFNLNNRFLALCNTSNDTYFSNTIPILNSPIENSERSQLKLSWLLCLASHVDSSPISINEFLLNLFPISLVGEYSEGSNSYYRRQRQPADSDKLCLPALYVPRQIQKSVYFVSTIASKVDSLVLGAFVNNISSVGCLTPLQFLESFFSSTRCPKLSSKDTAQLRCFLSRDNLVNSDISLSVF